MSLDHGHDSGVAVLEPIGTSSEGSGDTHSQGSSFQAADLDKSIEAADGGHDHAAVGVDLPRTADSDYSQQTGTRGKDVLLGSDGNDFLAPGDDTFKFNTASTDSGAREFPFPNDSQGSTELNLELKDGTLKVDGTFQNFDAAPLFSQGETEIDPKAVILNGSDPQALIDGFLKVPNDVEGNPISGTHLHFSPSEDDRGNFADAAVERYFTNTVNEDGKSGTISGEFELQPEQQAAALAGNLYANVHSNVDVDGDGKAGFPTGENRVNFNQNVVQFV